MSFLYGIFIAPIEMIVDVIFSFFINEMPQLGVISAVLGVSLCINFFALPLYNIADALQEKERKVQKKMEYRLKRIKETFKGDERFMITNEYYRLNGYHPLYALRSALSILIEIPFFIAAYQYLSHCEPLKNASWWIFSDLSKADELIKFTFFGTVIPVNVLPILMTLINFVSGAVYTKDAPRSEKIQLYVVALLFLVLLYTSPSGLVIYWILNNIFSLLKNIVLKTKHPRKILHICISILLLVLTVCVWTLIPTFALAGKISLILITLVVSALPWEIKALKKKFPKLTELGEKSDNQSSLKELSKNYFWIFVFSSLGLALLAGYVLTTNVISASPRDFCFLGSTPSPLSYIGAAVYLFLGLFFIWPVCIYKMFGPKIRKGLAAFFFIAFICALCNAFLFNHPYGEIENTFVLNHPEVLNNIGPFYSILPLVPVLLSAGILILLKKFHKTHFLKLILGAVCIAEIGLASYKTVEINKAFKNYENEKQLAKLIRMTESSEETEKKDSSVIKSIKTGFFKVAEKEVISDEIKPIYHLSKNGKNVIVLFLDRAISPFFEPIVEELNLKDSYKGFTYYPNTLSYGNYTLLGAPSMMGGYEYTPENINSRENESLRSKHNEASLVMPVLFQQAGFKVTVTDPPFPNFTWKGDLSVFTKDYVEKNFKEKNPDLILNDDFNLNVSEVAGRYLSKYEQEVKVDHVMTDKICRSGMQYFSFIQIIYPALRAPLYNAVAHFLSDGFNNVFSSLYYFRNLTDVEDTDKNTFMFIDNETPHTQAYLNVKDIMNKENPEEVDVPSYSKQIANEDPMVLERKFKTHGTIEEMHYDVNAAALKKVAQWLDYLKEKGVYDNTRIIIVADHGRDFETSAFMHFKTEERPDITPEIPAFFNPLMLVKDFNSDGELKSDYTLMTNADTLYLAKDGLNVGDKNPLTGKQLIPDDKKEIRIYEILNSEWNSDNIMTLNQFTQKPENSWTVKENLFEIKNWKRGDK